MNKTIKKDSDQLKQGLIDLRRRQILQAAREVFAEKGYHNANIADIASHLGMGHGTFYRYFENKLDIFCTVLDEVYASVAQVVADFDPESCTDADAYRHQVAGIARSLTELLIDDPTTARLLFFESWGLDEKINCKIRSMMDSFGGFTANYLQNGKKHGYINSHLDIRTTALAINAIIFEGAKRVASCDTAMKDKEKQNWYTSGLTLILDGIIDSRSYEKAAID